MITVAHSWLDALKVTVEGRTGTDSRDGLNTRGGRTQWEVTLLSGTEVGAVAGAGAGDEAGTGIGAGSGDSTREVKKKSGQTKDSQLS